MGAFKLSKLYEIHVSRIFSRNRVAGDYLPPGDTSFLSWFWVLEEEPLGDKLRTAKRCVIYAPVLGFCLICLAVMNNCQATQAVSARFSGFLGSGKILIGGKAKWNC